MSEIITVDDKIKNLVKLKFAKHLSKIKELVTKEAMKNSHVKGVKNVRFVRVKIPTKKVLSFDLGEFIINEKETNIVLYGEQYNNGSDTTDELDFEFEKGVTDSWHWEITAGVTYTYKTEIKIPALGSASEGIELNLSASYGETHSESEKFKWGQKVYLQPRYKTIVNAVLKQLSGTVPFTSKMIASGTVYCDVDLDIKTWPDQTKSFHFPLERLLSEAERTYTTTGVITGAAGLQALVVKSTCPLTEEEEKLTNKQIVKKVMHAEDFDLHFDLNLNQ